MNGNDGAFSRRLLTASANVLRRLADRAASRIADVDDANERANVATKTLGLFYWEEKTRVGAKELNGERKERFETFVGRVRDLIADAENVADRDYLRGIFLKSLLRFSIFEAETSFVDATADALLSEIDGEEERQEALYAYSTELARRVARLDDFAATREKALELADELDDLRLFEEVVATSANAVLYNLARRKNDANSDETPDASVDVATICNVVRRELNEIVSDEGFLRFFGEIPATFAIDRAAETRRSTLLFRAFEAETRRRLTRLIAALDSGKDADGEPLGDADLEDFQNVAENVAFAPPFLSEKGDFWRSFAIRFGRLDLLNAVLKELAETEIEKRSALAGGDASEFLAAEKEKTLEATRRAAKSSDSGRTSRKERALLDLARIEFLYGDRSNGKNAVREVLATIHQNPTPGGRARTYRRIVEINLDAGLNKAAKKTAELLLAELEKIEPEDFRDFDKRASAPLLERVGLDAETLERFVERIGSPAVRFEIRAFSELERVFAAARRASGGPEPNAFDDWKANFDSLVEKGIATVAELPDVDAQIFELVAFGEKIGASSVDFLLESQ